MMTRVRQKARLSAAGALVAACLLVFACSSSPVEEPTVESEEVAHDHHDHMTDEEKATWDVTAAFLAGIFTLANSDGLDSTIFFENFRANYDWIKDEFLPHIRNSSDHNWWECDEYCIKTARLLAKGDKEKEKELRETLSRYRVHERK
jgi:hypothetical protein